MDEKKIFFAQSYEHACGWDNYREKGKRIREGSGKGIF